MSCLKICLYEVFNDVSIYLCTQIWNIHIRKFQKVLFGYNIGFYINIWEKGNPSDALKSVK
jgi:hypothetical protein